MPTGRTDTCHKIAVDGAGGFGIAAIRKTHRGIPSVKMAVSVQILLFIRKFRGLIYQTFHLLASVGMRVAHVDGCPAVRTGISHEQRGILIAFGILHDATAKINEEVTDAVAVVLNRHKVILVGTAVQSRRVTREIQLTLRVTGQISRVNIQGVKDLIDGPHIQHQRRNAVVVELRIPIVVSVSQTRGVIMSGREHKDCLPIEHHFLPVIAHEKLCGVFHLGTGINNTVTKFIKYLIFFTK